MHKRTAHTPTFLSANMTVHYDVKIRGIDKLVEGSWAKWKRDVTFAFLKAGLVGYMDGSLKTPTDLKDNPD